MNCANHSMNPAAAYCRTCGKPLCSNCTRQVMGVIYCENCLAERVSGGAPPPSPYQPGPGSPMRPQPQAGPHPGIAGILAGFFPFGVGAVYCGQYAKGLAHFIIATLLIVGQISAGIHDAPALTHVVLGLCMGGFYFYQLIDAVKSAKAMQIGQPVPDPFGLGSMFSTGERQDLSRAVPTGALVLIVLGVLFLLHNLVPFLELGHIWPMFLIALGVWLFAKRRADPVARYRSVIGPVVLVTLGVLFLLDNMHGPGFDRTWPALLLVIGVIKLMERGYFGGTPTPPTSTSSATTVPSDQPPNEVDTEVKNG